jgi:hypothetical protein
MRMRRFSLRILFLATALVAAGCYWLILPTINAQGFVRAVARRDYARADDCFRDRQHQFLFNWNDKHWHFKASAGLEPWSFREFMRGERLVRLRVTSGDATVRTSEWIVAATRSGLLEPQPTWPSGGVGGGGSIEVPLIPTAPTS